MTEHTTGTRAEWRRAPVELLELEKEHTRRGDQLARTRRELPWVRIDKQYPWEDDPGDEGHDLSSFALEHGATYPVYSTYGRGTDVFNTFYQLLNRAPKGRDEDNIPAGEWWWRRHDEYEDG